MCRSKTSGKPILTICPMSRATSSTRSVIITKSLCPRMTFACCASCTLMAPSSPTLELRGREHSNCTSWAQRLGDPKLRPPGNEAFGLFVRRMGSPISDLWRIMRLSLQAPFEERGLAGGGLLPLANKVSDTLAKHHRGHVGVGPNTVGHNGGVHDAQVVQAVHLAILVYHRHGV